MEQLIVGAIVFLGGVALSFGGFRMKNTIVIKIGVIFLAFGIALPAYTYTGQNWIVAVISGLIIGFFVWYIFKMIKGSRIK